MLETTAVDARKRSWSKARFLRLAIASMVSALIALAMAFWGGLVTLHDVRLPLTPTDYRMLVTSDVVEHFRPGSLPERYRSSTQKRYSFDGTISIEHRLSARAPGDGKIIDLISRFCVFPDQEASRLWYEMIAGLHRDLPALVSQSQPIAGGQSKLEATEQRNRIEWGEESFCALILEDGLPLGNVYIARSGRSIYFFYVSGIHFETADSLGALLSASLDEALRRSS